MEKASNSSNKSTKFSTMLQKALSVGHSAAPFSPGRDFRHHRTISTTANRGSLFSTPTAAKVKRRTKNDVVSAEPTSPKVSCIGQIKPPKNLKPASSLFSLSEKEHKGGSFSKLKRFFSFSTGKNLSRKSNPTAFAAVPRQQPAAAVEAVAEAPSLGKMMKFASSREGLGRFDSAILEESQSDHRYDEDLTIPYSVRIPLTQMESFYMCPKPKSEVNLWKRRTIDPPKPLQVKAT